MRRIREDSQGFATDSREFAIDSNWQFVCAALCVSGEVVPLFMKLHTVVPPPVECAGIAQVAMATE